MKKKTQISLALKNFENATEALTQVFVDKYFPDTYKSHTFTFWVSDEIGGVFFINDYFFGLDRILETLRLNATQEQLLGYYEYEVSHAMSHPSEPIPLNFSYYIKQNETRKM